MSKKKRHGAPVEVWPRDIPGMREDCAPGLDAQGRGVWAPEHATEQAEEHCPVSCEARTWAPLHGETSLPFRSVAEKTGQGPVAAQNRSALEGVTYPG